MKRFLMIGVVGLICLMPSIASAGARGGFRGGGGFDRGGFGGFRGGSNFFLGLNLGGFGLGFNDRHGYLGGGLIYAPSYGYGYGGYGYGGYAYAPAYCPPSVVY